MSLTLQTNNLHIMKILTVLLFALSSIAINAQSIDEELGFIYVKADYLLETDRYEDAIREFTKIIAKDPSYKDALYKRGSAKYAIAAFKGTKNDLMQAFDVVGITPESLELYGKTLQNLDQNEAATITLNTASMINMGSSTKSTQSPTKDTKGSEETNSNDSEKSEIEKLEDKLSSILEDLLPDNNSGEGTEGTPSETDTNGTRTGTGDSGDSDEVEVNVEVEEKSNEPDVSVNEIYVDEDLTIEIKNGLGGRAILDQPNILILSDKSGEVTVDVCVNANGKVTFAEFNKNASSLQTQSLVSLAVRKSKEFWFKKSDNKETCGVIVFKITGGA
jgi:tetratricopeptide (TPR) repeat protein